ncbi:type II toxin-antitoxin system VapC family toxin [Sphingomonas sp. BK069]|uniref:type II toxin-antitoxin system VapC family toxin n=1 Tax=Sphingomonas sp. BK069 TaxID=2586979 RepID=UPI00161B63EC|nr:type II toxin-antitoxin system VapC family toxin [Sphingomonas sp. BK069]MBB3349472.1 PIN domain nuclease of toxin-antitoxin system [Sphingomonas sp. BK069]
MTDRPVVLDASAILAAFFDEPGADRVAEQMSGALISAVNYAEVIAKLVDLGTPREQILEIMAQLDVEVIPADRDQGTIAGLLRAETRSAGLSLGDRSCLALAISCGGVALTMDRAWASLHLDVEILVAR